MNAARIEVLAPGAYASVQDRGRRGFRRIGVPWAGVLDPRLMRIANALVGNPETHAVIECFDGGLVLLAHGGPIRVAVAGDAVVELEVAGERRPLPPWRSTVLADGDQLRIRKLAGGRIAVVAIEGLALPETLGSVSTYARAVLGGVDGRALAAGMQLPVVSHGEGVDRVLRHAPLTDPSPIRVVLGPQADHFSAAALHTLISADYRISTEADRMGIRLEGPALEHAGTREIVSDATVPGSIQVPGNGQPIVLLADAQTAGGYPKIATVISADLPRLAACRPGQILRFARVAAFEAEESARRAEAETRALIDAIRPLLPDGIDLDTLYSVNLVGGVVHALSPEHRPQWWPVD
ncbi:5-oxoprolinase/urea amidolyase family protein [Azoarcus communis]|uniref:5-oxoprolinase subunit C family protein n=1 Tax=Parazoarcus communis TaxID=41977 RepID=UPI00145980CB|nr:biotin-dependent carboxyltransferase family protein [Parazoarcus communis]NMG50366.1 5-oxoprolinase/urea amidolyase family protein [Parazoarcus communis]